MAEVSQVRAGISCHLAAGQLPHLQQRSDLFTGESVAMGIPVDLCGGGFADELPADVETRIAAIHRRSTGRNPDRRIDVWLGSGRESDLGIVNLFGKSNALPTQWSKKTEHYGSAAVSDPNAQIIGTLVHCF